MISTTLLFATLLLPQGPGPSVELFRGRRLEAPAGRELGYWNYQDATLEPSLPTRNFGGAVELLGGEGRTILIRFADLAAWLGKDSEVVSAKLVLTLADGGKADLISAARVLVPWGEGPLNTIRALTNSVRPVAPTWSATWQHRRAGSSPIAWQQAGAGGIQDSTPIPDVRAQTEGDLVTLSGLGPVVQQWRDRPYENFGVALRFAANVSFVSGKAPNAARLRPRLLVETKAAPPRKGADLAVESIRREPLTGVKPGQEVSYIATVRNLGNAPSEGIKAVWTTRERTGVPFEASKSLAPGEATEIPLKKRAEFDPQDPRTSPLALKVLAEDADPSNNSLSITEGGRFVWLDAPDASGLQAAQAVAAYVNDAIFPQSRFSFALEGVLQRVQIAGAGPKAPEGVATFRLAEGPVGILGALGLKYGFGGEVVSGGANPPKVPAALFGGFRNGEGDTRFEGSIPGLLTLNYEPYVNPLLTGLPIEPTGLLSGTDVASLNQDLEGKEEPGEGLLNVPNTTILKALSLTGEPLKNAELSFFQMADRKIDVSQPTFTVVTGSGGTAILPNRDLPANPAPLRSGKAPKPNPFGLIALDGSNGTFLVRAQVNGAVEWGSLSIWQLVDAYHRGSQAAAIFEMRFNVPTAPLDTETNLARGRIVTDSENRLPASAAALVDEDLATTFSLGAASGNWIEVDLGRDRPVGEVRLLLEGSEAPAKFDIVGYATGQTAGQMNAWVQEIDSGWTIRYRAGQEAGAVSLAYRGIASRMRYIRILNVSGGPLKIRELRVTPAKSG